MVTVEIDKIRVSIGSVVKLGLKRMKVDVLPTNCHLLTYHPDGCIGNCGFCPQSQHTHRQLTNSQQDQEYLSRVLWPVFDLNNVISLFRQNFPQFSTSKQNFQRICLQSLNYNGFEADIEYILRKLHNVTTIPISIAIPPVKQENIQNYKNLGIDRICFALDTATEYLFDSVKGKGCDGPYSWKEHISLLKKAIEIFGRGYVSTHLIIGLGETEQEALQFIQEMKNLGVITGLFAFFPVIKTRFEGRIRPNLQSFRKIQLGKYLLDTKKWKLEDFTFDSQGILCQFPINLNQLRKIVGLSAPFETSGCPGCNRPYYTSSPREEQYNYPRTITFTEQEKIIDSLYSYCGGIDS
jgi:biotin synthase-related radical SAM superfamily protein